MANKANIKAEDNLREALKGIMSKPIGTLELDLEGENFLVLQFNVASPVEDQKYDLYIRDPEDRKGLDLKPYTDAAGYERRQMNLEELASAIEETMRDLENDMDR